MYSFQTIVDLVITVQDNNDNVPVFNVDLAGGYTFNVKEVSNIASEENVMQMLLLSCVCG